MEKDPEVEQYIMQFPDEFAAILLRLRALVHEVVPEGNEAIKWSRPHFSVGRRPVCYIGGFQKHVSLAFHDGRMLRDPEGILTGTGKMRTLKLRKMEDLDDEKIRHWLLEAFYT